MIVIKKQAPVFFDYYYLTYKFNTLSYLKKRHNENIQIHPVFQPNKYRSD
ncbi:hypothetical protein SAMN04488062_10573 [Flavobacterium omnivorum]|uniref:Uncharacterized protein n=1 Tax=Flavobacterium omnivorum TaxID=178355 RepID=A0A1G8AMW3_9FLAO|nr:hypothetical protein SAMN04488062_10573 [Flavobacterium omnivorum]